MSSHEQRFGPTAATRLTAAVLCITALAACVGGCTARESAGSSGEEAATFDPLAMTWSPRALQSSAPCLVGWRSNGSNGELISLFPDGADPVIWRAPAEAGSTYVQLMAVDPAGERMVGEVYAQERGTAPVQRVLLFEPDGRVRDMPRPEGFEGISDVAFSDQGIVAIACHATLEDFETKLGLVRPEGTWSDLTLTGEVPEFQFVESISARPGSDLVGLVLKLPGGPEDRDDDMLVLARLDGTTLTVVTPPFYDDCLPGAQPLFDGDGVTYARLWAGGGPELTPSLVRVEWTGSDWRESDVLPTGAIGAGAETGQAVAHGANGDYWVRQAGADTHGSDSMLLHLPAGAAEPESLGRDLGGVSWFAWVEGK